MLTAVDALARFASHVLVLQKGGSMVSLESSSTWLDREKNVIERAGEAGAETLDSQGSETTPFDAKVSEPEDDNEKVKRQVGDSEVWLYYAKSIGVFHCLLLFLFTVITIVAANFPRTYSLPSPEQ